VWSGLWPDAWNENAPVTSNSDSDLVLVIGALSFQLRAKRAHTRMTHLCDPRDPCVG
jgi:hypothetical protein